MKRLLLSVSLLICLSLIVQAQKTEVVVPGYIETGTYGTLNDAIDAARGDGSINNTVFKLKSREFYVLSRSIFMSFGENLEIVAPKPLRAGEGTPEEVQNSAPPQIVWTEEAIDRQYIIQTYGDVTLKNIWVRYADFTGAQVQTAITFEDSVAIQGNDIETGNFEGCLFDYARISAEGAGTITVKADHFVGIFKNCYFRNNSDFHFQYYGRAVSFPYQSSGYHYDSLLFENCSFTNLGRIVMQEGNEYGDNIHINHCTLLNCVEWVYQSAGWIRNASITNSVFVNPHMFGYQAVDVCGADQDYDDFEAGLCDPPGGGLINGITQVDSFGFVVPFTDLDRKIFIGNNVYMYQDWLKAWYTECPWAVVRHQQREDDLIYHPSPMLGENEIDFIDSVDAENNKVFRTMNVDWATIYDTDPGFLVPATNEDTLKLFIEGRWGTGLDIDWAYDPYTGFAQLWPLPENLAYNNVQYKTAAMGGFPLGDLNWYPDQLTAWEAQRDQEWNTISDILNNGITSVNEIPGKVFPAEYILGQNYPNPFNPSTKIEYATPRKGFITLKVFNMLGQEVATLFSGIQSAGNYVADFDGSGLSSGIYFYQLKSDRVSITKKLVLMK